MKYLLIASLGLFSLSALAEHSPHHHKMNAEMKKKWDSMSFEDAKKMKSEKLSMKKEMINEAQNCVDKSTDKPGLEKCWEKMEHAQTEMKGKMMKKM